MTAASEATVTKSIVSEAPAKLTFKQQLIENVKVEELPADQWGLSQTFIINVNKVLTPLIVLYHIVAFNQWENPTAWVYFGCHGTYGLLWVAKTLFEFEDKRFATRIPPGMCLFMFVVLGIYWAPIRIICQNNVHAPAWVLGLSVMSFGVGVFFHFASDLHKVVFLEFRAQMKEVDAKKAPRILKDKMWAWSRSPNYLGELLIYLAFAMLSMHWFPVIWTVLMVAMVWYPAMLLKQESLSRFGKEYEDYQKSSYFFIPFLW